MPDPNERKMLFFADSHIGAAELGTRLHQQIEFYAAAAGLGAEDIVVLQCNAFDDVDLADLTMRKREFPDPCPVIERLPRRGRTRDWEQRDRKPRRR